MVTQNSGVFYAYSQKLRCCRLHGSLRLHLVSCQCQDLVGLLFDKTIKEIESKKNTSLDRYVLYFFVWERTSFSLISWLYHLTLGFFLQLSDPSQTCIRALEHHTDVMSYLHRWRRCRGVWCFELLNAPSLCHIDYVLLGKLDACAIEIHEEKSRSFDGCWYSDVTHFPAFLFVDALDSTSAISCIFMPQHDTPYPKVPLNSWPKHFLEVSNNGTTNSEPRQLDSTKAGSPIFLDSKCFWHLGNPGGLSSQCPGNSCVVFETSLSGCQIKHKHRSTPKHSQALRNGRVMKLTTGWRLKGFQSFQGSLTAGRPCSHSWRDQLEQPVDMPWACRFNVLRKVLGPF